MLILCWLKNLALRFKNGEQDIDIEPMAGPEFSLKKRKLADALAVIVMMLDGCESGPLPK